MNIYKHPGITHAYDLQEICKPLAMLDITYFAHAKVDAQNRFCGTGIDPTLSRLYLENKSYNHDIHVLQAQTQDQLILSDACQFDTKVQEAYDVFASFGYGHLFTIMQVNDKTGVKECFHFATRLGNTSMNERYFAHLDTLHHFIQYFKDAMLRDPALKKTYDMYFKMDEPADNKIILPDSLNQASNLKKSLPSLNRIYPYGDQYITPREYECLYWLSQGKSFSLTAQILGLTERTIKAHITNAKERLQCNNLFQLGMIFNRIKGLLE